MAFETLRPHQTQILGLIGQGRTLAQIADILAVQHGVHTTPGTLSRFASSLRQPSPDEAAPHTVVPALTPTQHAQVDVVALKTEWLAEIDASRQESRESLEHLAGKIAALSGDIVELEKAVAESTARGVGIARVETKEGPLDTTPPSVPAAIIRTIWIRAAIVTASLWGGLLFVWRLLFA